MVVARIVLFTGACVVVLGSSDDGCDTRLSARNAFSPAEAGERALAGYVLTFIIPFKME